MVVLHVDAQRIKTTIEQKKNEKQLDELKNCTFKPKINNNVLFDRNRQRVSPMNMTTKELRLF